MIDITWHNEKYHAVTRCFGTWMLQRNPAITAFIVYGRGEKVKYLCVANTLTATQLQLTTAMDSVYHRPVGPMRSWEYSNVVLN